MGKALVIAVVVAAMGPTLVAEGVGFGGGGFLRGVLFLELDGLNAALAAAGFPALAGELTLAGGSGIGGVTGELAFGGMGFGGSLVARQGDRSVELEIGYGAFVAEYPLALGRRALLSLGVGIGGGGATLTLRFRKAAGFQDALASPTVTRLETAFFGLLPHLRLQLAPLEWLLLDGWAGYLLTLPAPWQEGEQELAVTPSLAGPFLALEIVFGGMEPEVVQTPSY